MRRTILAILAALALLASTTVPAPAATVRESKLCRTIRYQAFLEPKSSAPLYPVCVHWRHDGTRLLAVKVNSAAPASQQERYVAKLDVRVGGRLILVAASLSDNTWRTVNVATPGSSTSRANGKVLVHNGPDVIYDPVQLNGL
jgi:hypothetical protein